MRISRISKALGVAAVSALALSACASSGSSDSSGSDSGDKTITVAETNEFSSLNSNTSGGNSDVNGKITAATHNGFYTVDDKLKIKHNEAFGKFEKISDNPLKVKYTVNDDQKWSDGESVGEADLLLAWASMSGYFNSADGKTTAFDYAGDTSGLGLTSVPEISDGGRTMTLNYSSPYVDWENAFDIGVPAHIVAKKAGVSTDDLVKAIKDGKKGQPNDVITKVAKAWNTMYDMTSMPDDKDLLVTNGAYKVKDIKENQSITLEKNDKYKGDEEPKVDEIVVRTMGDANAQIQALNNGEVDVVEPQASVDTIKQLHDAADTKSFEDSQLAYDHLDLNFAREAFKDENTRKAFLLTIPRQGIVDKLIKPMKDDATVLNSEVYVNSQKEYQDAVKKNDSDKYPTDQDEKNIAEAKKLLGGKTPTVKILYNNANPIRQNSFQMIQEAAGKAGFKVVDGGTPDWSKQLPGGDYDASIFGWVSSGVGHSGWSQYFGTGQGGNYGKYSNKEVDAKLAEVNKTVGDDEKLKNLAYDIDKHAFDDGYGLPLFQSPGITTVKNRVKGIDAYNPTQTGVFWNVEKWDVSN